MLAKVRKYIADNDLIKYGDKIVIGLSGGADSVCLFRVLAALRKEYALTLYAVHVNHGIRGDEAMRDEKFSCELAHKYDTECRVLQKDIPLLASMQGLTEEEAGRIERYNAFIKVMQEISANSIAVAHHANDQAETILFRMCRGTGIRGMCGMAARREHIIRPLLDITKQEICEYLDSIGQKYMTDSTNQCIEYDRNRIREQVIPELEKVNSEAVNHICRMSEKLKAVSEWFDQKCNEIYMQNVTVKEHEVSISITDMETYDEIILMEIIRKMIGAISHSMKDVEERHIKNICSLFKMQSGKMICLPYNITAVREYDKIILKSNTNNKCITHKYVQNHVVDLKNGVCNMQINDVYLPDEGKLVNQMTVNISVGVNIDELSVEKMKKNNCTKYIDCVRMKNKTVARRPQEKDYIRIGDNSRKKLTRYMIDNKIPGQFRDKIVVLACDNEVYMIFGGRIASDCYITKETQKVLKVNYVGE